MEVLLRHLGIVLIAVLLGFVSGCSPEKAPVMKRISNSELVDQRYLKDVFVNNYSGSKSELSNSVVRLEEHLVEFRDFMHEVETGNIPVFKGFKGDWESVNRTDGAIRAAVYSDRLGMVTNFEKRKNQDPFPLICELRFSTNSRLFSASTKEDYFEFDENGQAIKYSHK
jgi:hypothetical protein